ncbi:hypothetical protein P7C70_g3791, partial [Phenoliferia sp. Uapishka_3]
MSDNLTPTRPGSRLKLKEPVASLGGTVKARSSATSGGGVVASTSSTTIKAGSGGTSLGGATGHKLSGKGGLRAGGSVRSSFLRPFPPIVASESWDDDFLFQVSSTSSLALPLSPPPPNRSSRPTTPSTFSSRPSSRAASSSTTPPPLPHPSPTPAALTKKPWLLASESVESLSSSWSDHDPTLTHSVFPSTSNQTTPRTSDVPRRDASTSPHNDGWRSGTPSLSEADSSRSATADETEAESLDHQDWDGTAQIRKLSFGEDREYERYPQEISRPPWSTPRSSKTWKAVLGFGSGRRTGAREVIVQPEVSAGQFVVLGRRSRANSSDHPAHLPHHQRSGILRRHQTVREPKSSAESTATESSNSTNRSSLQFSPRPPGAPHSRSNPEPQLLAGAPPNAERSTISLDPTNWREYDSTSAEETGTEGEISEFSDEEDMHGRRQVTPSTSFATTSGTAAWDPAASQTSFASSASAFGLATGRSEWEATGANTVVGRRRKLKKKRPSTMVPEPVEATSSRSLSPSLNQPLLSSKASASSNGTSINTQSASIYTHRGGIRGPPDFIPPFAQDSGDEGRRRPRQRSATTPTSSPTDERGKVVEVERDWMGIVPFPPESNAASSSSKLPLASRLSRKPSAPGKSHPPVTGRNQSGTKRPLSLSSMLSRSTSAVPLGRRAPSPLPPSPHPSVKSPSLPSRPPSANSVRPSLSSLNQSAPGPSPSTPTSIKLHRHSSSVSDLAKPKESPSFFERARAFSRSGGSSSKPPPSPKIPSPSKVPVSVPVKTWTSKPKAPSHKTSREQMPPPVFQGRLNSEWKMPTRPDSTASDVSNASTSSTLRPQSNVSTLGPLPRIRREGSTSSRQEKGKGRPPPTRAQQQGHRPSSSLSSAFDRPRSPFPPPAPSASSRAQSPSRPRTAMAVDRPASYYFDDGMGGLEVPRRNSLSDLRIPSRITSSQARIEEDLERVKEFAKGIDDLKALRNQYQQLIRIVISPPSSPGSECDAFAGPSPVAINKMSQAIKRIEIDYQSWWEQAEALVDLGDGKPRRKEAKASPSVVASKRDRCVSLAQHSSPSKPSSSQPSSSKPGTGSDTETDELKPSVRPEYSRRPSASSFETGLSVEERQREMLWGVLAPGSKGASLPSRGPPSPRPTLDVLDTNARPTPTKFPSTPSPVAATSGKPFPIGLSTPSTQRARSNGIRRVSKAGVTGIKDFLLRLKLKASEEHGATFLRSGTFPDDTAGRRSVSSPTASRVATPTRSASRRSRSRTSSDEDEDWDKQSSPETSPVGTEFRRSRTQSTKVAGVDGDRMALTTEAMPSLLLKVKEVHERCSECVTRLKGLTV